MQGILYIPHIILNEDEKSFTRFVRDEDKKDYNLQFKVNVDKEDAEELSQDADKMIWNSTYTSNIINQKEKFQKVDKTFMQDLKNTNNLDSYHNIKLNYGVNDEFERKVFSPIPIKIFNVNGYPENIHNFIKYFQQGIDFPILIEVDMDNINPDAETQLKTWVSLTKKLYMLPKNRISDEMKFKKAPIKTFKLFLNKDANAYLENCKLIDKISVNKFIIYVKKITFYSNK